MEDLSNPQSEIYKNMLEEQKIYINIRMDSIKTRYFDT